MACGCFPLATDIAANAQWIESGRNGALFPVGDSRRLAEWIERAADAADLRSKAAARNWVIVQERADWRVAVRKMRQLYERCLFPARRRDKG
jgi:glycosyltransferase involved in cell wall biosynthesis